MTIICMTTTFTKKKFILDSMLVLPILTPIKMVGDNTATARLTSRCNTLEHLVATVLTFS